MTLSGARAGQLKFAHASLRDSIHNLIVEQMFQGMAHLDALGLLYQLFYTPLQFVDGKLLILLTPY